MVAEEEVVVCVVSSVVVVAGDGMGLLGESGASSRLARSLARSSASRPSAEAQPGMRSSVAQ